MNKRKIILTIICILVIIIIIIIIKLILIKTNEKDEYGREFIEEVETKNNSINVVKNSIDFYTVKAIANKYFNALLYEETESVYNMLDLNYIKNFNITKENVIEKLNYFTEYNKDNDSLYLTVTINDMYQIQDSNQISTFFVYGYTFDSSKIKKIEFSLMMELDSTNKTFYILPYDYMEKNGYLDVSENKTIEIELEKIENNNYNMFEYKKMETQEIINDYFSRYKQATMFDVEEAYNLLNEEYKKQRFGNLEEYKKYIKENLSNLISCKLEKYEVEDEEDYKEYICIDQKNNYYIFREISINKYNIILDTYTIDIPQFIETYNSASAQKKVALNIQKFIQAINTKDYNYAYNCLSDGFKNNYFKTLDSFTIYIQDNFFEINTPEYKTFSETSGLYKYAVDFKDYTKAKEGNIEKTFIIQLNEGTDFEISFNI